MRALVVDKDSKLGTGLKRAGYAVDWVNACDHAQTAAAGQRYDVVILDVGLPQVAGLQLLRQWRARGWDMPVVLVTTCDTVSERVRGLDAGADDYLIKPFDLDELLARLRALARRSRVRPQPQLSARGLVLDLAAFTCRRGDELIALSPREFAILQYLMENAGRVLSRRQIEESLYAWGDEVESNTVQVYIHHLRKKLGPKLIRTVRSVGYTIDKEE